MATIRLTPSTYKLSNSSYLTVSNASNMYANTDSTTYATIQNTRTSTSSYYAYIRGFNFSAVPDDAIVSKITIKLKAYHSGGNTGTIYCYDGTTQVSAAGSTTALTTSATVKTFTNTTLDWDTLKGYGSDFGIRINCRRSNKNTTAYIYIYGAEIEVTYTQPVYYNVSINNSTSATVTASDTNPLEGTDVEIRSSTLTGLTIKDNGTDVTSQFTQRTDSGESYAVENVGTYGFTLNSSTGYYVSNNKGVDKTASVCRVDFHVPVEATITFTYINYAEQGYDFGVFGNIDVELNNNYYPAGSSGATISDSSYKLACNTSTHNVSTAQTLTYTMSAGNHSIWVKYSKDDASAGNNDTLQFKVSITLNEPFTPTTYYGYDILNITGDHIIVVTQSVTPAVPPVITVGTPSRTIISDESGVNVCTCTFTSDLALQAWEARATLPNQTPARGVGLLVESGTSLGANVPATVEIIWTELGDDGLYTIHVYGQSTEGVWSE